MIPSDVRTTEDLHRIVEERDTKNVTIALTDTNCLLRGKVTDQELRRFFELA